jgi:hypothetical protein
VSAKNILVESGEFSDGARFFSRSALRSVWFIMTIITLIVLLSFYSYIFLAHWNQLSGSFVMWACVSLFSGLFTTLVQSCRMHGRIHEMFLASAVKVESGSSLEGVLDVAARTIQIWVTSVGLASIFSIPPLWWALERAEVLRH